MKVKAMKEVEISKYLGTTLLECLTEDMEIDVDCEIFYNDLNRQEKALLLAEVVRQFKEAVNIELTSL